MYENKKQPKRKEGKQGGENFYSNIMKWFGNIWSSHTVICRYYILKGEIEVPMSNPAYVHHYACHYQVPRKKSYICGYKRTHFHIPSLSKLRARCFHNAQVSRTGDWRPSVKVPLDTLGLECCLGSFCLFTSSREVCCFSVKIGLAAWKSEKCVIQPKPESWQLR